jgi:K+-transporting ATPase ATPase C chain
MIRETLRVLLACVLTFVICVVAYPLVVFAVGQVLFPRQAGGSLIVRDAQVVGSELIAQPFASDRYFSPRPSAAGPNGYAADAASGSNLGTKNPALADRIALDAARQVLRSRNDAELEAKIEALDALQADLKTRGAVAEKSEAETQAIAELEARASEALTAASSRAAELASAPADRVPVDLVTASGSGLDPHISPEAARYQAKRVATARSIPLDHVLRLIEAQTDRSAMWIGAPPHVNVLKLNLALDDLHPGSAGIGSTPP